MSRSRRARFADELSHRLGGTLIKLSLRHVPSFALLVLVACSPAGGDKPVPCVPDAEVCDGKDNDCNGLVDEGLGDLSCGAGACLVTVPACVNGVPGECTPGLPTAESCDGIDDDCDGVIDNGCECLLGGTQPCYSGSPGTLDVGACHGGSQACEAGSWGPCVGDQLPVVELCNGADDDCDGQIDEEQGVIACGVGACAVTGPACVDGIAGSCTPLPPRPEVCDGVDDDCDGEVDQGNPGGGVACSTGQPGVCSAGTTACVGGAIVCAQAVQTSAELCNGLDDDCDGTVDQGNPGGGVACGTGQPGVCSAGTTACVGGEIACVQAVQPSAELCDGLDDDCDGTVDEGNPGGGVACDTGLLGVCASGATACQNGAVVCVQNAAPSSEACNGVDDDCDATIDEGNPGGGAACGSCGLGTTQCSAGALSCTNASAGLATYYRDADGDGYGSASVSTQACSQPLGYVAVSSDCDDYSVSVNPGAAEACNARDDNCNGATDEGNPGGGASCGTGRAAPCDAGAVRCTSGSLVCVATAPGC
jgi:hypothetical protein